MKQLLRLILLFICLTSCIYDPEMSRMRNSCDSSIDDNPTNTTNQTDSTDPTNQNNPIIPGGNTQNSTKIASLQVLIDDYTQPGDTINLSRYTDITDYTATINKAVTIQNGPNLKGASLTVVSDGVVLDGIQKASVTTSNSLKISGSSLGSLSISSISTTSTSHNQIIGRGESDQTSAKPPIVEVTDTKVDEDVTVAIDNAMLTVENLLAKKSVSLSAENVQLTITDTATNIHAITTDKVCQVILEDGTSDTIPKPNVTGEGELKQINMRAAGQMKLVALTPMSGLVNVMKLGEMIDFSEVVMLGTYQADDGITVFKADGLSYNLTETFSKLEKDFTITINNKIAYKNGKNMLTFEWDNLTAGSYSATINTAYEPKDISYQPYPFTIVVVGESDENETTTTELPKFTLSTIRVDYSNVKKVYNENEPLNMTGLLITGLYQAGDLTYDGVISNYTLNPPNGTKLTTDTSVTVSIPKEEGGSFTETIIIAVKKMKNVTFVLDDSDDTKNTVVRTAINETVTKPNDPVKTGYEFDGWYNGENEYNFSTLVKDNITLTAKWTANQYNIIYKDRNGTQFSGTMTDEPTVHTYGTETVLVTPTKQGYDFGGWHLKANCTDNSIDKIGAESITEDITLVALFTEHGSHTIFYQNTKNANNSLNPQSFKETQTVSLQPINTAGYAFAGWYDSSADDAHEVIGWTAGTHYADVTVWAKWTPSTVHYTIKRYFKKVDGNGYEQNLTEYSDLSSSGTTEAETSVSAINVIGFTAQDITQQLIAADGSTVVEVYYDRNNIVYTFKPNGGKWGNNDVTRDVVGSYGATVVKPADPTKIGSTFDGWNPTVPETFGETNISFTAKWTTHGSHTITYNNTKGLTNPNPASFIETESVTLYDLTTDGYTFNGWSLTPNGGAPVTGWAAGDQTGDVILYAKWTTHKYTIHFDANGGDGTMDNLTVDYDATSDPLTCTFTAPSYKKFGSWNTDANGTGTTYLNGASVKNLAKTDGTIVTLYAQWIDKDAHSITYNNTRGADNTNRTSFLESDTITLSGITAVGYTFDGWYEVVHEVTSDVSIDGWNAGDHSADVTLWAKWTPKTYNVSLKGYTMITATYGALLPNITIPTKTGYTFGGYYLDNTNDDNMQYIDENGIGIKLWDQISDKPLHPKWTPTYTITFDNTVDASFAAGYTPPASYTYESDEITLPTADNITRPGYTFGGWYTDSNCSSGNGPVSSIPAQSNGNKTFYAKWTANSYTVVFNANGGTGAMTNLSMTYDVSTDLPMNLFTKYGCLFVGWATLAGEVVYANGQNVKNLSETNRAEVTLYARWQERSSVSVGQIMYSDMTFSSEYVYGKTPIGVVFYATTDKVKIVHLSEQSSLKWCLNTAAGYYHIFETSLSDGSGNWQIICNTIGDATNDDGSPSDNYPAFQYVYGLGKGWYMPAKDELVSEVYTNKTAIESAIAVLIDAGVSAEQFSRDYYWSSSCDSDLVWKLYFNDNNISPLAEEGDVETRVRAVRAF